MTANSRLEAGLVYTLSDAAEFGHLYLPEPKLLTSAAEILGIEVEKLPDVLENMAAAQTVIAEDLEIEMAGRPMRAFYHPALYYTEVGLAAQLRRRLNLPLPKALSREKNRRNGWQSRKRRRALNFPPNSGKQFHWRWTTACSC